MRSRKLWITAICLLVAIFGGATSIAIAAEDDVTPPVTTDDYDGAWHNTSVTVTLTATDDISGVAATFYSLDQGATWSSGSSFVIEATPDHLNDGKHVVSYYSVDVAGNPEAPKVCEVKIDTRPPVTKSTADSLWHNHPVTVNLTATDAGVGVAFTEYSLDGRAWTSGSQVVVSGDGPHRLLYRSADLLGHLETPDRRATVCVDTVGPWARAPWVIRAQRGKTAELILRVNDALSPKAKVTIKIVNAAGKVVKKIGPSLRTTNWWLRARFTCKLRKGTYRFSVYARDLAGNAQRHVGTNKLVVK